MSGSEDKTVRVWDSSTGRALSTIRPPAGKGVDGQIYAVAISPDAKTIACGGHTGRKARADQEGKDYYEVYVFAREGGALLHRLAVPFAVEGLFYSPDGRFLVATSRGSFASTSTDFGADRVFTTADYAWARDALIPNGGAALTLGDFDGRGRLLFLHKFGTWTAELAGADVHETREIAGIPTAVAMSADGKRIAVAFADSTVGVYDGNELTLLYQPDVAGIGPAEVAFTEDMDLAAASQGTVAWSADGSTLYYSGGRTCASGACFVRKWADAGRGAPADITIAASRVTRLVTLRGGGIAFGAVGPALGVLAADDRRTSFFADREPPAVTRTTMAAPARAHEEHAAPVLDAADAARLGELRGTIADLTRQGRWREALDPAMQAAAIVERAGDPPTAAAVEALANLARVQHALGEYRRVAGESVVGMKEYDDALALYGRAGPMLERSGGVRQLDVASLLESQGTLLRAMRRYDQAADSFQRAVTIRERARGAASTDAARAKSGFASVRVRKLTSESRFVDAFAAAQAALGEAQTKLPTDDPALADALADLGDVYRGFRTSYLVPAEDRHAQALEIRTRSLGPGHWDVAGSFRALAEIYGARKEYARATEAYAGALRIEEQALGADAPALATLETTVARLHQSMGEYADAEAIFRHVLTIRETEGQAYRIAHALEDLGALYRATGQPARAEPLYTRALAMREQNMGESHPTVGETARILGTLLRVKGDLAGAGPLCDRAVAIHNSPGDIFAPWALRDRAALASARGDDGAALGFLGASLRAQEPIFRVLFAPDREEKQLQAIESPRVSASYWFYLGLAARRFPNDPKVLHDAMELVLHRKGLVFDAQSMAIGARKNLSDEARGVEGRLSAARTELAALLLHAPPGMDEAQYREELAVRFEQCSTLERSLDRLAPAADYDPSGHAVSAEAVAAALPEKAVLVEIVRIPDFDYAHEDFDFPKREWDASARYLAFVLGRSGNVRLVDLGAAKDVERVADPVLNELRERDANPTSEQLKVLRARIWTPLGISAAEVEQVIIAPDGILGLVPFAALMEDDGTFLVERYELTYVTTGRDLLARPRSKPRTELLLVADPAFDAEPVAQGAPQTVLRSRSAIGTFKALSGPAIEVAEIPSLVEGAGGRIVVHGPQATETVVKSADAPRIMHLATHGFFLPDQRLDAPEAEYETPLVRSGLAFAGANHAAPTGADDGLLTALEISGIDLSATELVVLSACETGVGEVRSGEGVFGLRRAFALAGARNLLMSLWRVDDLTTADMMKYFYASLRSMTPAAALRRAQIDILHRLKEKDGQAPPHSWAAFVLQRSG